MRKRSKAQGVLWRALTLAYFSRKPLFVKTVLFLFYHFFKLIVRVSLWGFYHRTTVVNKEAAKIKGPTILMANHPSTVLDPLNVAIYIPRMVHFLANASLFKTPFTNWFFNTFYCIPIERYVDTGGKPLNNAASFAKATEFLTNGGILFIAPEGSSYVERKVRKLKTGLARIALNTEAANDFKLGLHILPTGINYEDPTKFRSDVLTVFGSPVKVADFKKDWEEDPREAVRKLTAHLHGKLAELTTDVEDKEEEKVLETLETIAQSEKPLAPFPAFERSQIILGKLKKWRAETAPKLEKLESILEKIDLSKELRKGNTWSRWALLLLTLPFFITGYLIHFLPAFLTYFLSSALNKDLHWVPTFKYCLGLILYPLILGLEVWLVSKLPGHWPTWLFLVSMIPLGLFAEWWMREWKKLNREVAPEKFAEQKKWRREALEMLNL